MKKFTALLLALVLTFSLSAVAFAAETSGITVKYDLGVNGSNDIQARTGDVITVAYRISASGSAPVMVSQNKIYYDTDLFELVENSNKPSAGFTDFTTVHRQNLKGEWRVFFSTTATHTYDTSWSEIGTLQLRVIAKTGSTIVKNQEAIANDMSNQGYSLSLQDLKVTVDDDGQQRQFNVVFLNEDGSTYKTETVNEGASLTLPAGPARVNATFSHWSTSGSQTKYLPGASYQPTGNVTFRPNWTATADLSGYQDAASVSAWAVDAMRWAVGAGLIQGRGASTLAPRGQATRAEVAAILMRFCQKIGA